ncbi:MAG: TetR/AcrR family transcriptional repressor of uid operon [Paraglaciecola sp.]|jgi:TetR/AcrR family transcriptional repressor of uid operon
MTKKISALATQQRERILSAAKQCFVETGLARTTMRDISSQADMSLGNIYRYFKNKEALIETFIEADNQEIGEAFELLDSAKNFKAILQELGIELIKEISNKSKILVYTDILSEALRNEKILSIVTLDHGERMLAKSLEKAQKEGRIQLSLPVDTAALAIIAFIENAALKCVISKKYSVRTAKKQFKQYLDIIVD